LPLVALSLVMGGAGTGCAKKKQPTDFSHELEPGRLALEKISPAEYPEFSFDQMQAMALSKSADYSADYLRKKSSNAYYPYLDITHDRALASVIAFKALADRHARSPMSKAELNAAIRQEFEVYRSIGGWDPEKADFSRTVLFTGYFTPIYEASLTKQGEFQWPLYKKPADLVQDPEGITASRRTPDGQYVLYYSRPEIEKGNLLAGQELVYLKSRWDAYVISIQGSAILRLRDGRTYEVGYAGNNGFPYVSPGKKLLAEGKITKEQLSLRGLKSYFESHPAELDQYVSINPRFVFFTERPGGPFGSLNEPVTAFGTVATDKTVYPRAMPSFVQTQIPTPAGAAADYQSWLMDQDTGGAIRAAGRADIYMGKGPNAEQLAGHQLYEGKFYYIAVKPEFVGKYLQGTPAMPVSPAGPVSLAQ
jgi:membrane-bound lytic murein transglycosylase A